MTYLSSLALLICFALVSCTYNQASDVEKPKIPNTTEVPISEAKIDVASSSPISTEKVEQDESVVKSNDIETEKNQSISDTDLSNNKIIEQEEESGNTEELTVEDEIEASKEALLNQKNEYEISTESDPIEEPLIEEQDVVKPIIEEVVEPEKPMIVTPEKIEPKLVKPATLSHDQWNTLLSKYVSPTGTVNYGALKKNESKLDAYLNLLEQTPPSSEWSNNKQLAYWINAYNAYTVKLILNNYPVSSITNLHGGKPWDQQWINIAGKTYSLNDIEHKIIRPQFKEPRIHFAVVCAAKSCPPLLNKAFTEQNIDQLLDQITKAFINNSVSNTINAKEVQVSKIFDWYGEDFGDLIGYLNKYSSTKINSGAKISFKDYDWSLNE